jgi:hypothetical protein
MRYGQLPKTSTTQPFDQFMLRLTFWKVDFFVVVKLTLRRLTTISHTYLILLGQTLFVPSNLTIQAKEQKGTLTFLTYFPKSWRSSVNVM